MYEIVSILFSIVMIESHLLEDLVTGFSLLLTDDERQRRLLPDSKSLETDVGGVAVFEVFELTRTLADLFRENLSFERLLLDVFLLRDVEDEAVKTSSLAPAVSRIIVSSLSLFLEPPMLSRFIIRLNLPGFPLFLPVGDGEMFLEVGGSE